MTVANKYASETLAAVSKMIAAVWVAGLAFTISATAGAVRDGRFAEIQHMALFSLGWHGCGLVLSFVYWYCAKRLSAKIGSNMRQDMDLTLLCEEVMRGNSAAFMVSFSMDKMKQCRANTPDERLRVLAGYFGDVRDRIETIRAECNSTGEEA